MIISSEGKCVAVLPAACMEMKDGKSEKRYLAACSAARTRAATVSCKCHSGSTVSQRE